MVWRPLHSRRKERGTENSSLGLSECARFPTPRRWNAGPLAKLFDDRVHFHCWQHRIDTLRWQVCNGSANPRIPRPFHTRFASLQRMHEKYSLVYLLRLSFLYLSHHYRRVIRCITLRQGHWFIDHITLFLPEYISSETLKMRARHSWIWCLTYFFQKKMVLGENLLCQDSQKN